MGRYEHMGRSEQHKASLRRKADARKLFEKGGAAHTRGAVYLAGYAIECKLKCIAMERNDCWTLKALADKLGVSDREVFHHGLEVLVTDLGLLTKIRAGYAGKPFAGYVNKWRPTWRYDPSNVPMGWSKAFLDAVDSVYKWLDANR